MGSHAGHYHLVASRYHRSVTVSKQTCDGTIDRRDMPISSLWCLERFDDLDRSGEHGWAILFCCDSVLAVYRTPKLPGNPEFISIVWTHDSSRFSWKPGARKTLNCFESLCVTTMVFALGVSYFAAQVGLWGFERQEASSRGVFIR